MFKISQITIFSLLVIFISCSTSTEKITPNRQNISLSVYASGKVVSKNQYEVQPNGSGYIQKIFVSEGDIVNKGDILFSLSNEATELNQDMARLSKSFAEKENNVARLKDLEVKIKLAQEKMTHDSLLWERQKKLHDKGIGTNLDLEQRLLQYSQSETELKALHLNQETLIREIEFNAKNAQKNFEIASSLANDLEIKSKIDGKVYSLLKETGELVNQQSKLAVLGNGEEFILELLVDEYDIAQIKTGQEIKINLDSYRGEVFDATVTKIHPIMDDKTKSFVVEAEFTKSPPQLYPNLTLEANIILQTKENALLIPSSYLIQDQYVISIEGDTIGVKTGIKNYQNTEILSGIEETTELIKP
ncbi:efflux RND transporter periplasmic adaptor subunit [Cyclobacterium plantarum]|uniref:efflux RND transporter periplasmic adaptor subunit n=1 Tax=Cyclobacterium plantarum TaxID=2716263 RepID=UPI003F6F7737